MLCYRYLDYEYGVESVISGNFKVASPQEFNDPLDCYGNACGTPPRHVLVKFAKTFHSFGHSTDDIADFIGRDFDLKMAAAIQDRSKIGNLFRLLCFSDVNKTSQESETLMWAHYADKGFGVRVLFDIPEENLPNGCAVRAVDYAPDCKVPMLLLSTLTDFPMSREISEFYARCIYTKGPIWGYENEIRMIIGPEAQKDLLPGMSKDGSRKVCDLYPIPRSWIKGFEFGSRVRECDVADAIARIRDSGLRVCFKKAVFDGERYCYDYWQRVENDTKWKAV